LRDQLDHMKLERMAPERVQLFDDAVLANVDGDAMRKYLVLGSAAVIGLGLVVLGSVGRRARG